MSESKFVKQLEFHKIPEYYDQYIRYSQLREYIQSFKKRTKSKYSMVYLQELYTAKLSLS